MVGIFHDLYQWRTPWENVLHLSQRRNTKVQLLLRPDVVLSKINSPIYVQNHGGAEDTQRGKYDAIN